MYRRNYGRVGANYYGDFRERSNEVSEYGFEILKKWLGYSGDIVISNVEFVPTYRGLKVVELKDQDVLSNLRLLYEIERGRTFHEALGDYRELIVIVLMLEEKYSKETAANMAENFYYYCICNMDKFVPKVDWKNLILMEGKFDDELQRYTQMMSSFHLTEEFMEMQNSRIGMYQKFVLASTSDENLILSLKNEEKVLYICCEYNEGNTKYVMEMSYLYESFVVCVDLRYNGIFGECKYEFVRRLADVIDSHKKISNRRGLNPFSLKKTKCLWILKNLNDIIEKKYFDF